MRINNLVPSTQEAKAEDPLSPEVQSQLGLHHTYLHTHTHSIDPSNQLTSPHQQGKEWENNFPIPLTATQTGNQGVQVQPRQTTR